MHFVLTEVGVLGMYFVLIAVIRERNIPLTQRQAIHTDLRPKLAHTVKHDPSLALATLLLYYLLYHQKDGSVFLQLQLSFQPFCHQGGITNFKAYFTDLKSIRRYS